MGSDGIRRTGIYKQHIGLSLPPSMKAKKYRDNNVKLYRVTDFRKNDLGLHTMEELKNNFCLSESMIKAAKGKNVRAASFYYITTHKP